jgi:tetratricopeptide (TPR) repeat protein
MFRRHTLHVAALVCSLAPVPAAWGREGGSWVGKEVLTKRSGVRISQTDDQGRRRYVATLTARIYEVEKAQGDAIQVRHGGVRGWFPKADAVPLDEAVPEYAEAIRLDPKDPAGFNGRGTAWYAQGEYDKAIADYSEAIRLDPKDPRLFDNRGLAWYIKREYDKALADCSESIRLDPKNAVWFFHRGNVWMARGEYDKALADYAEAIRLDPKDPDAYQARAWLWATCPESV